MHTLIAVCHVCLQSDTFDKYPGRHYYTNTFDSVRKKICQAFHVERAKAVFIFAKGTFIGKYLSQWLTSEGHQGMDSGQWRP